MRRCTSWRRRRTFEVTDPLLTAGTFSVYPDGDVKMYVGEVLSLDISTASEAKIESKSSKATVVDVMPGDDLRKVSLVGRSPGTADRGAQARELNR